MLKKTQKYYKEERRAEKKIDATLEHLDLVRKKYGYETREGIEKIKKAHEEIEKAFDEFQEFLKDEKQSLF